MSQKFEAINDGVGSYATYRVFEDDTDLGVVFATSKRKWYVYQDPSGTAYPTRGAAAAALALQAASAADAPVVEVQAVDLTPAAVVGFLANEAPQAPALTPAEIEAFGLDSDDIEAPDDLQTPAAVEAPEGLPECLIDAFAGMNQEQQEALAALVRTNARRRVTSNTRTGTALRKTDFFVACAQVGSTLEQMAAAWAALNVDNEKEANKLGTFKHYYKCAKGGSFGPKGIRGEVFVFENSDGDLVKLSNGDSQAQAVADWIAELELQGLTDKAQESLQA